MPAKVTIGGGKRRVSEVAKPQQGATAAEVDSVIAKIVKENGHLAPPPKPREIIIRNGKLGIDVDQKNRWLHPGFPVIYWSGDGRGNMEAYHGHLSHQLNDGRWAIDFMQRGRPSYHVTIDFSERPKSHHWTTPEVWVDWKHGKVSAE